MLDTLDGGRLVLGLSIIIERSEFNSFSFFLLAELSNLDDELRLRQLIKKYSRDGGLLQLAYWYSIEDGDLLAL